MKNFWHDLPQPFVGLAPMDGITDQPLRQIVARYARPDVIFTEFINVEGLCHNVSRLLEPLRYDQAQRPIVAQLYGKTPKFFQQSTILAAQLGFDGVDINMGCPSKTVAGGGGGAGLIKNPDLAVKIIKAVQQGVQDWADGADCRECPDFSDKFCKLVEQQRLESGLNRLNKNSQHDAIPVSVKTRLGRDKPEVDTWIKTLLTTNITALTVHGRTLKQGYTGQADWELIGQVAQLAKKLRSSVKIIGNGDLQSYQHGVELAKKYKLAGTLIGRAAQGNPFVFQQDNSINNLSASAKAKRLAEVALEHARLYEKSLVNKKKSGFFPMRKHLAWYIKGLPQAKEIRMRLVRTNSSQEVEEILRQCNLI